MPRRPPPSATAVAVLVALAVAASGSAAAPGTGRAACTDQAATIAITASPALRSLLPTLQNGGGVDRLICRDLTRDGVLDMAATIFSGGTAGDTAWVVFRQANGRWTLALRQLQVYKP